MKHSIYIVPIIFVLASTNLRAQSGSSINLATTKDLKTPNDQLNIINEQFIKRDAQIRGSNANMVLISQVGQNNVNTVTTMATNSVVSLSQNGNDNTMQLDLRATTIDYQAIQNGDNNMLLEFSNGADTHLLQRSVEQTGNGQNLIIHGSNALSDRMIIRMKNDGQSVIIRNTN